MIRNQIRYVSICIEANEKNMRKKKMLGHEEREK